MGVESAGPEDVGGQIVVMPTLNVITTCTKDKRAIVDPSCQLRDVAPGSIKLRATEWRKRLSFNRKNRVSVRDLYSGDHWATIRELNSRYFDVQVWVCSAGYGLIHIEDEITPYSATFSRKHPDSVWNNVSDGVDGLSREWWSALSRWKGHAGSGPRSLKGLAEERPKESMLVVASANYLRAILPDLQQMAAKLASPENLCIVSSGSRELEGLGDHLIPCDARMQAEVNGARRSLNARLAQKIVSEARAIPRKTPLKKRYRAILNRQPEIKRYDRRPAADGEVIRFILRELNKDETVRHTPLLRRFRDKGFACEQKRFASLFKEVSNGKKG